ncbi:hypothetical protein D3C77_366980 [compost metagenome]
MRLMIPSVLVVLALSGCANNQQTEAFRAEALRTTPTCDSTDSCEVKWSAARRWVLSHAGTKIQNYGSDYFDTYNPIQNSPLLAAQISKDAVGGGKYAITAKLWCDNMFGCQPNAWEALVDFNRTVNAAGNN